MPRFTLHFIGRVPHYSGNTNQSNLLRLRLHQLATLSQVEPINASFGEFRTSGIVKLQEAHIAFVESPYHTYPRVNLIPLRRINVCEQYFF